MTQPKHETSAPQEPQSGDTLKELEHLLSQDVLSVEDDEERLIPAREVKGMIIRFSVLIVLSLLLFFTGILPEFSIVLIVIMAFAILEGFTLYKNIQSRKNKITFKVRE